MKNKVKSIHTRQKWFIWTMLSVSILHFIVFWIYVNFDAIMLAFKNMDYASGNEYWTLSNFDKVFELFRGGDENVGNVFFHYLQNTMKYWVLGTVWCIPHSILLTYVFHKKIKMGAIYRVILYIPSIISSVVIAGIFYSFIQSNGVFGQLLLKVFNVDRVPNWFMEDEYATKALLFYNFFFGFAGHYVIYSGAMAKVSNDILEAAMIDGVNMWNELWKIDIPLMWPTISMTIITSFAGIFGASGNIFLFTPYLESTYTLGYYIFDQVRRFQSYYIPAALGLCMTAIGFPLCLCVKRIVSSIYKDVD